MNQKCSNCSMISDELKCYDCYRKVRNIYVPAQAIDMQRSFIYEHQEELFQLVSERFKDLQNLNTIERISMYQKKYCEVNDDLRDQQENLKILIDQNQEIIESNARKRVRIQYLKMELDKLKLEQQKTSQELMKRDSILMNLKRIKFEQNYNLRVINHCYPNWSINNELEKIEIPFYLKKGKQGDKQYQNYILFKKKQNFLTQVQQQQFLFSLNQIALFIYSLQTIFNISSHFPLIRKAKEQITVSGEIRIYDENLRIIYDENIIYIYLNYKLILQRFHIMFTRNPYFFFDFTYFKDCFLSKQHIIHHNQFENTEPIKYTYKNNSYKNNNQNDHNNNIQMTFNSFDNLEEEDETRQKIQKQNSLEDLLNMNNQQNINNLYNKVRTDKKHMTQQISTVTEQQLDLREDQLHYKNINRSEEPSIRGQSLSSYHLQFENHLRNQFGKTFRLLLVKSPLIKIEYEDNLKQKEIGFNDPQIYSTNKVVLGGWEVYEEDDY